MTTPITSGRNPRIIALRKLADRKGRAAAGRFAVEGLQSLHMALDAGAHPLELFYTSELFTGAQAVLLLSRVEAAGAELMPIAPALMHSLSERDRPAGLIATFAPLHRPPAALPLDGAGLVLVLDRPADPGNIGTLFRTADAVGARALLLLTPCADPYDPRAVRASMGSLFNVPFALAAADQALGALKRYPVIGADAHAGARWDQADWRGGRALLLGSEAGGLSADVTPHISQRLHLPVLGKADSLNVAVAGGVLMYTWLSHNIS